MLHLMGHEMSFVIMCFGSGQKNVATSGAAMETLLKCASPFRRCIDNAKDSKGVKNFSPHFEHSFKYRNRKDIFVA